jgi:hypothetical protein
MMMMMNGDCGNQYVFFFILLSLNLSDPAVYSQTPSMWVRQSFRADTDKILCILIFTETFY